MPLTFVMVCEAQADFQTASALADRVLCEEVDWIDAQVVDAYRSYLGTRSETTYMTWAESAQLAKALGRRAHGHFDGKRGALDALAGRRAILIALSKFPEAQAMFLIRDSDGLTERQQGLMQARAESMRSGTLAIVIGVAHCKREAWILAGFEPHDKDEQARIDALRQELGFHPCQRAHDLDAKHDNDKRSAKRALNLLAGNSAEREAGCISRASLALLRERGQESGLANFLGEVSDFVIPLFADRRTS